MQISKKTAEKLRKLINEETEYRRGKDLVAFFNQYGFHDKYGNGFPSRDSYTYGKIQELNGKPELDRCIKDTFSPINFNNRFTELDTLIEDFNQYLRFDGWRVIRRGIEITFTRATAIDIEKEKEKEKERKTANTESEFLNQEFAKVDIGSLPMEFSLSPYIESRINEIKSCFSGEAYLAVIFLAGSTLEGVLLGLAQNHPTKFKQAEQRPKDKNGRCPELPNWTLAQLIDVSHELGFLKMDVKKFSHTLRDFRNYIHPCRQMIEQFTPDKHTAMICSQVLNAALCQIVESHKCG